MVKPPATAGLIFRSTGRGDRSASLERSVWLSGCSLPDSAAQLFLDLDGGAAGHVVAVVGAVVVVVDCPGLQGPVEQGDVVDAAAVEVGPVELTQHGAVEPLADGVVVR